MTSLPPIEPLVPSRGPDIHQCPLNIYLSEYPVDELLSRVLLTVTTAPLYGKLTQVAITKRGFPQVGITTFLSQRIMFLNNIHSFWGASREAVREGETTTHCPDCLDTFLNQ